jgi:hypothetical protein
VAFTAAAGGSVPVACLYGGQSFTAIVETACAPVSAAPALAAWQIAAHKAILGAYDDARTAHETAVSAAVAAQAPDGAGRLIANELTLDALAALAAAAPSAIEPSATPPALSAQASRFFVDALDWRDCVSAFFPWGVDPVRRPSPVRWAGQSMSDRNNPAWLETFLQAGSARLLVSVRRGYETAVLFFLAFGYLPGRPEAVVVPATARGWIESLMTPEPREDEHGWRLQIPTDLIALADGPPAWSGSAS